MNPVEKILPAHLAVEKAKLSDYLELTKPRLTFLVMFSALVGFYMGSPQSLNLILMFHTLVGTALVAGGSEVLNQYLERDFDARMVRTQNRPIPAGRIDPQNALIFGTFLTLAGIVYLAYLTNLLTGVLAAITAISYVFVYTPLKRVTPLNTWVGAIPGALPPLGGWAAAQGTVTVEAWILFAIVYFWQFPHFLSIAWIYQKDYARAGYKMLPAVDPSGERTAVQILLNSFLLLLVSLIPTFLGLTGTVYLIGALVLSIGYLVCGMIFRKMKSSRNAWRVLIGSFVYLPLLWAIMMLDKN